MNSYKARRVLLFVATYLLGLFCVWRSAGWIYLFILIFPELLWRGIYFCVGMAIVRKNATPRLADLLQFFYLLTSLFYADGTDTGTCVFACLASFNHTEEYIPRIVWLIFLLITLGILIESKVTPTSRPPLEIFLRDASPLF
ncbi:MAG: hypothetical protein SFW66_10240 [Gammaproteobacteria bacterium]|nr:hypothetical protein [Gammaproteobacteria bacterium]